MRLRWLLLLLALVTTLAPKEALGSAARDAEGGNGPTSDDTGSDDDVPVYYVLQPESNPHPPDPPPQLDPHADPAANDPGAVRVVKQASPQPAANAKPSQKTESEEDLDDDDGLSARIREEAEKQELGEEEYAHDVHYMDADQFHRDHWPPKKPDGGGAVYDLSPQGLKEWKADRKKAYASYDKYVQIIQSQQDDLDDYLDSVPRPYPYCVTGLIPNYCHPATPAGANKPDEPTDRKCLKFVYKEDTKLSNGPEKDETTLPIHNNWYPASIFNQSGNFKDIKEYYDQNEGDKKDALNIVDPHLVRYFPIFRVQPPNGIIEQLRENGEAPDVTETRKSSYLSKVEFRVLTVNQRGQDGLLWPSAQSADGTTNGATVDNQMLGWTHIIVTAKEPLQGVFIQAISYPMGLPFGEFRDDFECNAGGGVPAVVDGKRDKERQDTRMSESFKKLAVLPCRYSHGNNFGDAHPMVYAFGGSRLRSTKEKPPNEDSAYEDWNYGWGRKSVFRTHFRWSSVHCNLKMRVQFIIMAVKNFEELKFEVFRTVTYVLQMTHGAGSPPPYVQDWTYDCKISSLIKATGSMLTAVGQRLKSTAEQGLKKEQALSTALHIVPSSRINIVYDSSYDRCILHYHGYGHFGNTPQCKPKNVPNPDCSAADDGDTCSKEKWVCNAEAGEWFNDDNDKPYAPPPKTVPGGAKPYQVLKPQYAIPVGYPPVGVCPPAEICLNGMHTEEASGIGYRSVRAHFDAYRDGVDEEGIEDCDFVACTRPKEPRPFKWGEDVKSQKGEGVDFGREYHEAFDSRNSALFRRLRGEHVWTLTLSWFVLMFVGNFVGRYYKETAGVHIDGTNSILGLGWWIWVHMFLLLLSATFMWIGILVVLKIRRIEPGCNQLEKFEEFTLKNYCRQRRRIVRFHRTVGYVALCLYLTAFFMAWRRPNKSYTIKKPFRFRFNERKFYFWMHIAFAYASKFVAVLCVAILLWVETEGICKDIPILVLVLEFFSIGFFITGHIIQRMEDKTSGMSRSKVIPEAIDANVSKKWYKIKFILVMVTCAVHYLMFLIIMIVGFFIYNRNGEGYDSKEPRFEVIKGFLHWGCNVTNKQAEVDIYIDRFPFLASLATTD